MDPKNTRHRKSFISAQYWNYNVYLSFRSKEKSFVDHLNKALIAAGIQTFRGDEDIPKGHKIASELLKALEGSRLSIVVFSKDYASSSLCLDDLVKILECKELLGQVVIPVFYQIHPSDVCKRRGSFGDAFATVEVRYIHEMEKVDRWRSALTRAASISGWELHNIIDDGFEANLIADIVADVEKRLKHNISHIVQHSGTLEDMRGVAKRQKYPFHPVYHEGTDDQYSSSSNLHWNYDVFLSFRGEDTRKTFTGHLYTALVQAGIRTFKDDDELARGHNISSTLIKTIEESRISLVILSENYASSRWCLEELLKIMECMKATGQLVIPVFYHVDPSDIRRQRGSFAKAFVEHEECIEHKEKVNKWRSALTEAGKLCGWDLHDLANGHESTFIRKIVTGIEDVLDHKMLRVAKHPVGLDSPVEHLYRLLKIGSSDVRVVGIYGMGGTGKTTISKAFYNSAFRLFEGSCFLANVREESKKCSGLVHLQEQLLSETLKRKKVKIANCDQGFYLLKRRLCGKRVLIILDDVDKLDQLDSLAGDRCWFGAGSRIIITTRDKSLLNQVKVDEGYEVKGLNPPDSLRLFNFHAFREPQPLEGFLEISNRFVSYAGGLPLALAVIGSALIGKTMVQWESSLKKLQKIPHSDVQGILRLSFVTLEDDIVKNIFLDIACFYIGMDKEQAIDILDSCDMFAENGIGILNDRCLLTICEENKLHMHDLLRDMGREIVRAQSPTNPGKRSRLWFHEDAHDVLKRHKGSEEIRGLVLDSTMEMHLDANSFAGMQNLQLLQMDNAYLNGSFEGLFKDLRWLCWRHCPLKRIPPKFYPEKLVYLDLQHSNVCRLWQGKEQFVKLKILDLSYSKFSETPDLTQLRRLEKLTLRFCANLVNIHPSIGSLDGLIHLDLGYCNKLRVLPSKICNLRTLKHLDLGSCSSLDQLPEHLGSMKGLEELFARGTAIKQLPDSIGNLTKLTWLSLQQCNRNLQRKPCFPSLLQIFYQAQSPCTTRFLPISISSLCSLRNLDLSECNLLEADIPDNLDGLTSLQFLHLERNKFCRLPLCLSQLYKLESLWLDGCTSLHSILGFPPNLRNLYSRDCTSLETLPNLSNLKCLEHLELTNCCRLVETEGLENVGSLLYINLEGCSNLTATFGNTMFQEYSERNLDCAIYLPRRRIPQWFEYQGESSIIVIVPHDIGVGPLQPTLWVDYTSDGVRRAKIQAEFSNRTTSTEWTHHGHSSTFGVKSWVSHGPQPYPISSGDRIEIFIKGDEGLKVEKCGVHLAYRSVMD